MQTKTVSYGYTRRSYPYYYETISDRLWKWAESTPARDAAVFVSPTGKTSSISCRDVYAKSKQFAESLRERNVMKGDIIALSCPNCPEWMYCEFGIIMAGAIALNLVFTYKDGSDVVALLNKLKVKMLILHPGTDDTEWRTCSRFIDRINSDGSVQSTKVSSLEQLICIKPPSGGTRTLLLEEVLCATNMTDKELTPLDPDDIAILFQTSGSTGLPKVVAVTHFSIIHTGLASFEQADVQASDVCYNGRAFRWSGGFPFGFLVKGLTRITLDTPEEKIPDLSSVITKIVNKHGCTILYLIPLTAQALVKNQPTGPHWPVNVAWIQGQPVTETHIYGAECLSKRILIAYGTTEAGVICIKHVSDLKDFSANTVGVPAEGVEIKIVDANGSTVAPGVRGELFARTRSRFRCYFSNPEKTAEVINESNWYKTGDIAMMTEDGEFFVECRHSDVIICGGINASPAALESVIRVLPGVADVLVVPVPDAILFQQGCACVILKPDGELTLDAISKYLEDIYLDKERSSTRLPGYYLLFDRFPTTDTGKVHRKSVTLQAAQRLQLDR